MSRSALWRQEVNVVERQRKAEETLQLAVEEGKSRSQKGLVKVTNDNHFNINPMLLQNISKSPYFQKCCNNLNDWNALVDEIYYEVKTLEPWSNEATRTPSTAFCLLLRLLTMRCTIKQMELMLNHVDSPYIRCIGFLYLRYACDPKEIWDWFMPYLYDEEPVKIAQRSGQETVGDFVKMLLDDLNYYGTRLPRFPLTTEREMKVKLLQEEQIEARAVSNEGDKRKMDYFQKVGSRVRALYGDEENPVTWYDGVIDRVIWRDDETGTQFTRPKFIVTFPDYGNTETVSLGEMDMPGGSGEMKSYNGRDSKPSHKYGEDRHLDSGRDRWDHRNENGNNRNHAHHHREDNRRGNFSHRDYDQRGSRNRDRSRSRDRSSPSNSDLMEEVKRREREKVFAKGRAYASRPATFKQSLSVESGVNVSSRDDHSYNRDSYHESAAVQKKPKKQDVANSEPPSNQKTEEELAAVKDKKRKLMAKYG